MIASVVDIVNVVVLAIAIGRIIDVGFIVLMLLLATLLVLVLVLI